MPALAAPGLHVISFDWPALFALLPAPFLVRRFLAPAAIPGALALPIAAELRGVMGGGPSPRIPWPALLAWGFLVLACAQPRWTGAAVPLPVQARDLLLAVDASGSMDEKDVDAWRGGRSRYQAVQELARDFITRREGDRVGLILFGTRAYLYCPLSLDRSTVAQLLTESSVGLAGDGTAIGDAILTGVKHLRESAAGERVLILLTDGENTAGSITPLEAARFAAEAGVRVHAIGFGSESPRSRDLQMLGLQGPRVEEKPLMDIAVRTQGRYFRARNTGELAETYRLLDRIEPAPVEGRHFVPTRSLFHWPLALALALAVWVLLQRRSPA